MDNSVVTPPLTSDDTVPADANDNSNEVIIEPATKNSITWRKKIRRDRAKAYNTIQNLKTLICLKNETLKHIARSVSNYVWNSKFQLQTCWMLTMEYHHHQKDWLQVQKPNWNYVNVHLHHNSGKRCCFTTANGGAERWFNTEWER